VPLLARAESALRDIFEELAVSTRFESHAVIKMDSERMVRGAPGGVRGEKFYRR